MPTSLTNDKMPPELRARVEAAVGARPAHEPRFAPLVRLAFRTTMLAVILGAAYAVASEWHARAERLDEAKQALDAQLMASWHHLEDSALHASLPSWVAAEAGQYPGDVVSPDLRRAGLASVLAHPMVYLRAPASSLQHERGLAAAAVDSLPDAFVHCLVAPPGSDAEGAMHSSLEAAFGDPADWQRRMSSVHRAHDLIVAHAFDRHRWTRRLEDAEHLREVASLRAELDGAHLERAAAAAGAKTLIVVVDEPRAHDVITDLDGAHRHHVRVSVIDAETGLPLLRMRREVDPGWISEAHRAYFGRSLVACRLALELRAEVDVEI